MKRASLLKLFVQKEKSFWIRNKNFFLEQTKKSDKLSAFIIILLVYPAHYCFALMHLAFEIFLWLVNQEQFKKNLHTLALSIEARKS